MPALAYLLTFSTYGTHLPGSEKGWVDARHCLPGSPMLAANPAREAYWRAHLNEIPWTLDCEAQRITLEALRSVCIHRRWVAHAMHIRTNHVHAVVAGEVAPERILTAFKAYATRAFRGTYPDLHRRRYWTDHGSTRYLWNEVSLNAAVDYALNGQGTRMACYPETTRDLGSLTLPGSVSALCENERDIRSIANSDRPEGEAVSPARSQ